MIPTKFTLAACLSLLAIAVSAADDRRLVDLPNLDSTCTIWENACKAAVPAKDTADTYCQSGTVFGGTDEEATVYCTYTTSAGATVDITADLITSVGLVASA